MSARLGINIDHVATLREARGEGYPSIERAAQISLDNGADQITIHLRDDRRHIQDHDIFTVKEVCQRQSKLLNFEMGQSQNILDLAVKLSPDWVCLVPENREEKTTEGGLDLCNPMVFEKVYQCVSTIREKIPDTKISFFTEANVEVLEKAAQLKPEAIEIHTGSFAIAYNEGERLPSLQEKYISTFKNAKSYLDNMNIATHAGHGLTEESLKILIKENIFEEFNIGHWVISEAVFKGLGKVVSDLREILH
jgi:pyridoxine 5-phosphate synthase